MSLYHKRKHFLFPFLTYAIQTTQNFPSIYDGDRQRLSRVMFERSLRQSKDEWESTFDAMGDIITIQDKEMRILKGNKTFYETFEGNPDTLTRISHEHRVHLDKNVAIQTVK